MRLSRNLRVWNKLGIFVMCVVIVTWLSLSNRQELYEKINTGHPRPEALRMVNAQANLPLVHVPELNIPRKDSKTIVKKIASIAKLIHNAKKHVRSSKTADILKIALDAMNSLLIDLDLNPASLYNRTLYKTESVCPEIYKGTTFGYPYFYDGFESTNCGYSTAIWKLVTIIKHIHIDNQNTDSSLKETQTFLSSVYKINTNFNVIISTNDLNYLTGITRLYPNLTVKAFQDKSEGFASNALIREVKTPYVLVARNVQFFTNDSRLERLIREIETLGIKVAGGAIRNPVGHWKKGCFQSMHRNFTLKHLEGYDESLHECLFCDYIQGPFIASKAYLDKNQFENLNENSGLFEEWFLRISHRSEESIVCPDSMFHVHRLQTETNDIGVLEHFMPKWNLFKLIMPNEKIIRRTCKQIKLNSSPSRALSPCAVQSNADAVKIILKTCEEAQIFCELQEGTALGAVKLGKTLPWERDADITFLTANYSAFQKRKEEFVKAGFVFNDLGATWCCVDNKTAGGKFKLHYKGWLIEMYGQHIMDSESLVTEGMKPTKVLLDGQWVNMPRNPGLFVRNRYGREIYQHAEHWMTTGGKTGWINYKTNVFKPCSKQGEHDCLDRFNADGDLPFNEMLP